MSRKSFDVPDLDLMYRSGMSMREIASRTSLSYGKINRDLHSLEQEGLVVVRGRGGAHPRQAKVSSEARL